MKSEPRTVIVNIRMSPTEVAELDELVIAMGKVSSGTVDRPTVIREALRRMRVNKAKPKSKR
jgi:hypothetical protein